MYIRSLDDLDVRRLQLALNALVQWSDAWQLPISINKCCILNISKVTYNTDVLMVAPYLLLHTPVTWGSLYQATCLLLYTLQTLAH